jgi:hypothetical protein
MTISDFVREPEKLPKSSGNAIDHAYANIRRVLGAIVTKDDWGNTTMTVIIFLHPTELYMKQAPCFRNLPSATEKHCV